VPSNTLFTNRTTTQCHPIHYSLIAQPISAIQYTIHQSYNHSVPSNTLFTNCTTIQCHPIHYSPIIQPFSAIQYTIHESHNHSVPSNTLFTNCTTIQCHPIHYSPMPSNTIFTNRTTIQCHPIHYSPIVQPFSAIQYIIHQSHNHSVPYCPTTDSTYSTTSNSYLLMLHPLQ